MLLNDYEISFPAGFDGLEAEAEAKGWLQGVVVAIGGNRYMVTIYDPARLAQDIQSELQGRQFYLEPNVIVVPAVTRARIEEAIAAIVQAGALVDLIPLSHPSIS